MFKDSRIETNLVGVTLVPKFLAGNNIQPVGGTKGDGITTNTKEFLKDVDTNLITLLTVEVLGDKPEIITFHVILGSNVPPILGNHYMSPQHRMYTTMAVSNKEYIENIHITHGHIQLRQLKSMLANEGKWQPLFTSIIEDVIEMVFVTLDSRWEA